MLREIHETFPAIHKFPQTEQLDYRTYQSARGFNDEIMKKFFLTQEIEDKLVTFVLNREGKSAETPVSFKSLREFGKSFTRYEVERQLRALKDTKEKGHNLILLVGRFANLDWANYFVFNPQEFDFTPEMKELTKALIINVIRDNAVTESKKDLLACLQGDQIAIKEKDSRWNGDWYISMQAALQIWQINIGSA